MLVVVDSPRTNLYPGSVALAMTRCFSATGTDVLFVDANCTGRSLAERLGEAMNLGFSPGERGVPTLMMSASGPLSADDLKNHSYRLDNPSGASPWLALGPTNLRGAAAAVSWLDGRADELAALEGSARVVVAASLKRLGAEPPMSILARADVVVVIAPVSGEADRKALVELIDEAGLGRERPQRRMLLISDAATLDDGQLADLAPLEVLGQFPALPDAKILTPARRLRRSLDPMAAVLDPQRRPRPVVPRRSKRRAQPARRPAADGPGEAEAPESTEEA